MRGEHAHVLGLSPTACQFPLGRESRHQLESVRFLASHPTSVGLDPVKEYQKNFAPSLTTFQEYGGWPLRCYCRTLFGNSSPRRTRFHVASTGNTLVSAETLTDMTTARNED